MRYGKSAVAVALFAAAGAVQAAGVGVKAGTTGLGADFGWEIAPTLGGRIGAAGLTYSTHVDTSDIHYDAKLKAANLNLFLDWSPLGPFRITAGIVPNNNKIDMTGQPTNGTFTLNGHTYSASEVGSLTGTVKPGNSAAPYLGIGYGNVWTKGVNFYFDLGVMFQGSPKATLSLACGPAATPAQCAQAQNDVAAEQARVEDKLKKFQYYPVGSLGITIGF
jgi:hypothetical protein